MNGWNFSVVVLYIYLCLLFSSFTEDVSAGKAATKQSTMTTDPFQPQHRLLMPLCKTAAFKLRAIITRVGPESDCQKECTEQIDILDKAIGKGSESFRTRPIRRPQPVQQISQKIPPVWLENCMAARFHCLRQLSDTKVTTAELTGENLVFPRSSSDAKMGSSYFGFNHCRCYATLKLFKVFRDDVTMAGDSTSTNCSNVEICKRLTVTLSEGPGWVCIAETTLPGFVVCKIQAKCRIETSRQVCKACNTGAIATLECEPVDWSEESQKARAIEIQVRMRSGHSQTASALETETSAENSLCQGFGNVDEYRRLQLTTPSRELRMQIPSRIPHSGPLIRWNQSTDGMPIEEPILDFIDASAALTDDFSDIDLSIFFTDVEPFSPPITDHSAFLASLSPNGKHVRSDQGSAAEVENDVDLDDLLPKRSRWERGESSNSAHDRSMSRTHTGDPAGTRNTISSEQSRTYASVISSLNLLPASNSLQASGQTIQLDGSWLDIYRQLGPTDPIEPMPDLASLGSFQTNVISSVGYNAEQPDFEDLVDGGDPPSLDADADNELDEFFSDFL